MSTTPTSQRAGIPKSFTSRVEFEKVLKRELRLQLELPCPACKRPRTMTQIAQAIGVTVASVWRFLNHPGAGMLSKHHRALAGWLRAQGVPMPDPPKETEEGPE